jgi:hypothetical protein
MYQLGHKQPKERKTGRYVVGFVLLVALASGAFFYRDANNNTKITKGSTALKTGEVKAITAGGVPVNEPTFTLELPANWKETGRAEAPQHLVEWHSTAKATTARSLRVYIDTIPSAMALNRLLPVSVNGNQLVAGEVSSNCSTFIGPQGLTPAQAGALKPLEGKWQDTRFICDLPNYIREVAGTGSTEGINTVSIVGPTSGKHRYFFVYTDHTAESDFGIFTAIVNSFRAK